MSEIQKFAAELKPGYAGDREKEIEDKEAQVLDAWHSLLARVSERGSKLGDSDEFQRFLLQIQDLLIWIQEMRQEIASDERPKYVSFTFHSRIVNYTYMLNHRKFIC